MCGRIFGSGKVLRTLEAMFAFRHRLTRDDLRLQAGHPCEPMNVAISGCNGLVGGQLRSLLTLLGHTVRPIVRQPSEEEGSIAVWQNDSEREKLNEVRAVVHLAGKPIASGRWNDKLKREIRDSRVEKTGELCRVLASLDRKPEVLVCASATGIYGDRQDERLDEDSVPGNDFLAQVAQQWEEACRPAIEAGIRVVHARFGMILSPREGALAKMLLPAKLAGGSLGSGKQWWSWIALDDAIGALYHAMTIPSLSGPVNFVSPQPCTNQDFASTLASVLGRPALFPAPAFALRAALGEMAQSLLLASTRVTPKRLHETQYRFR
ncbi:MAG: TIGR01777 family oxidoreductase, partial [Pirellulales bacterium]|nr:TIGR01777 family oxidoreductase [Pirellulales bacterium]